MWSVKCTGALSCLWPIPPHTQSALSSEHWSWTLLIWLFTLTLCLKIALNSELDPSLSRLKPYCLILKIFLIPRWQKFYLRRRLLVRKSCLKARVLTYYYSISSFYKRTVFGHFEITALKIKLLTKSSQTRKRVLETPGYGVESQLSTQCALDNFKMASHLLNSCISPKLKKSN